MPYETSWNLISNATSWNFIAKCVICGQLFDKLHSEELYMKWLYIATTRILMLPTKQKIVTNLC